MLSLRWPFVNVISGMALVTANFSMELTKGRVISAITLAVANTSPRCFRKYHAVQRPSDQTESVFMPKNPTPLSTHCTKIEFENLFPNLSLTLFKTVADPLLLSIAAHGAPISAERICSRERIMNTDGNSSGSELSFWQESWGLCAVPRLDGSSEAMTIFTECPGRFPGRSALSARPGVFARGQ